MNVQGSTLWLLSYFLFLPTFIQINYPLQGYTAPHQRTILTTEKIQFFQPNILPSSLSNQSPPLSKFSRNTNPTLGRFPSDTSWIIGSTSRIRVNIKWIPIHDSCIYVYTYDIKQGFPILSTGFRQLRKLFTRATVHVGVSSRGTFIPCHVEQHSQNSTRAGHERGSPTCSLPRLP